MRDWNKGQNPLWTTGGQPVKHALALVLFDAEPSRDLADDAAPEREHGGNLGLYCLYASGLLAGGEHDML
jgi:hypothetical protein